MYDHIWYLEDRLVPLVLLNDNHLLINMYDRIWYIGGRLTHLALNDNHLLINIYDHIWYVGGRPLYVYIIQFQSFNICQSDINIQL